MLEKELQRLQKKEAEETAVMERAVQQVEENLVATTVSMIFHPSKQFYTINIKLNSIISIYKYSWHPYCPSIIGGVHIFENAQFHWSRNVMMQCPSHTSIDRSRQHG